MAGETDSMAREAAQRAVDRRKRLAHLDDKNTDKYYRSGQVSAINPTGETLQSDIRRLDGEPQIPVRGRRLSHLDDKNTDKYYRSAKTPPTRQQLEQPVSNRPQLRPINLPTPAAKSLPKKTPFPLGEMQHLYVSGPEMVNPIADEVCSRLNRGADDVSVDVADFPGLALRFRTAMDAKVVRGVITEDQYRDVTQLKNPVFSGPPPIVPRDHDVPPVVHDLSGAVIPQAKGTLGDPLDLVDPVDFLNGNVDDDEDIDTSAETNVTEVDDVLDPDVPSEVDEDVDDADDTTAPATAQENQQSGRRRGRKRGRGAQN